MIDLQRWLAFVGVLLVILCTPGPDFLVVLRHSLEHSRAGYRAVAGIITGLGAHTAIAVAGITAAVAAHPSALAAVRGAGATYLAWLGIGALRSFLTHRREPHPVGAPGAAATTLPPPPAGGRPYRTGLLTNLLNPKAVLFFVGLLPQFLDSGGNVPTQVLLLAATTMALAAGWLCALVRVINRLHGPLTRPRIRRALDGVTAVAFFALALSVAW
ncbi:LysE family translocator [Phytoactinopolyspora limicola]|uniref:LysE family translocator n=1 Tax=Phytoactinopolyspora limicola TaxID=2715536 RepID=UPI00140AF6A4|nr:LysE family translocator [Phytoactinopolyspora limicola]